MRIKTVRGFWSNLKRYQMSWDISKFKKYQNLWDRSRDVYSSNQINFR